jgi:hypothetical protein
VCWPIIGYNPCRPLVAVPGWDCVTNPTTTCCR